MKCFVNTMVDVLSANMRHAVGYPSDRFHFQQSGTSASAIDKLLNCDGFFAICCPDATRCLCPAAATQRTEMSSHTPRNGSDRRRLRKCSFSRPVANKPKLRVDPTNVHVLLLQQEVFFCKLVGSNDTKEACGLRATVPLCFWRRRRSHGICLLSLCVAGPRVTQATEPYVVCTAAQSEVVAEAENILKLQNRRHGVLETFSSALPKGMFWLRTSILLNATVGNLLRVALKGEGSGPCSD